ncbi:unnamed protein product [Schistosoma bovis]|nr:unnamed protein product [Schistosoma bovis]
MLHNHPCSSSWMVCDPLTRRLSSEEKENLKPVILHCESADEVCRYPCRHMLLAYVKRRNLTAHQLLRYCSRWKLHNTQNFQNYTLTGLTRRSEVYISIQRSQRIHKQRIIEKYGERFATEVEKKVDNYYLRILNTNL